MSAAADATHQAEELLKDLRPGETVLVWYDGDSVWHERLAVAPVTRSVWFCATPDHDAYAERLAGNPRGDAPARCLRMPGGRVPEAVTEPVYRFAEPITDEQWQALWDAAVNFCGLAQANAVCRRGEHRVKLPAQRPPLEPVPPSRRVREKARAVSDALVLGDAPKPRKDSPRRDRDRTPEGPAKRPPDSFALGDTPRQKEDTHVWILSADGLMDGHTVAAGTEVDVLSSDLLGARFGVHIYGGSEFVVERVPQTELSQWRPFVRGAALANGAPPAARPGVTPIAALRAELGRGEEERVAAEASVPKAKPEEAPPDLRVLEVDYDTHGTRVKVWSDVCAESSEHRFRDWPVDGPLTVLNRMKHILRYGPLPTQWVESWARRKHIAHTDRVFHELRSLAEVIETLGVYDQINLPALAGVEILFRRFQSLLEAHAVPGAKPNYGIAEVYAGGSLLEDGVSPELRSFGARRLREKQLENSVQRGPGGAPQLAAEDGGAFGSADVAGDEQAVGRAAGKGRRRGRPQGFQAPAAITS